MAGTSKNWKINEVLAGQVNQFERDAKKRGVKIFPAHVVNGALLGFFGLPMGERLALIGRAKNLDLENAYADATRELAGDDDKTLSDAGIAQSDKAKRPRRRRTS